MKILTVIVRTLLGALFLFASISYFFDLIPQPDLSEPVRKFMEGVMATGYLMTLIKGTEVVGGLALISGMYAPLALVVLAPISLNIFLFHYFVDPKGMPVAIFVLVATLFLGYAYRDRYRPLFKAR